MEGVQFNEDSFSPQQLKVAQDQQKESKMVRYLITSGLAKDSKQGTIILVVCILILLIVSAFIFARQGTPDVDSKPYSEFTPAEKQRLPESERIFLENLNK